METKVKVTLVARQEVEIYVTHEPDEDPTDLDSDDEDSALWQADTFPVWEIEEVEEVDE